VIARLGHGAQGANPRLIVTNLPGGCAATGSDPAGRIGSRRRRTGAVVCSRKPNVKGVTGHAVMPGRVSTNRSARPVVTALALHYEFTIARARLCARRLNPINDLRLVRATGWIGIAIAICSRGRDTLLGREQAGGSPHERTG